MVQMKAPVCRGERGFGGGVGGRAWLEADRGGVSLSGLVWQCGCVVVWLWWGECELSKGSVWDMGTSYEGQEMGSSP